MSPGLRLLIQNVSYERGHVIRLPPFLPHHGLSPQPVNACTSPTFREFRPGGKAHWAKEPTPEIDVVSTEEPIYLVSPGSNWPVETMTGTYPDQLPGHR